MTEETGVVKPIEYKLTKEEKQRLVEGIQAYTLIGNGDINGYHWEDLFSHVKSIPKTKNGLKLYDIVNIEKKIGWSAKTKEVTTNEILPGSTVNIVIQRSNIFSHDNTLSKDSPVEQLGEALLRYWNTEKISNNMESQGVEDSRVCILIKSKNRSQFAYYESSIEVYDFEEIEWKWNCDLKIGLTGVRRVDGAIKYVWNPNQSHFREIVYLPKDLEIFSAPTKKMDTSELIEILLKPKTYSFKETLNFWYKNIVGRVNSFMNKVIAKAVTV